MLLTEKEAAEKWCPLFQAAVAVTVSGVIQVVMNRNRIDGAEDGKAVCMGSRCMAWRWGEERGPKIGEEHPPNQEWDGDTPMICPTIIYGDRRGYCGAFGKVEPVR